MTAWAFRWTALLGMALLGLSACSGKDDVSPTSPAEPDDYRQENYRAPVPSTLRGAGVVDTDDLLRRLAAGRSLLVDVLPREPRPPRLAPDNVWLPPPHLGIPGAVWLPNVGYGRLPASLQAYFAEGLLAMTGADRERVLIFYCRSECWMSWNAARRALDLGYRHVLWYRDGIEAWRAAGHPVSVLQPFGDGPPAMP